MAVATSNEFLESLRKSGLIETEVLDEALSTYTGTTEEPTKIAEYLIQKKMLTSFQAKSLLAGRYKGLIIGSYRMMDKIGAGGMGIVYLAEHDKLKRRVAIKILPEDKTRDKLSLERFYREARAAAALDHPNIVKAFDVNEHQGLHYLVMEYIDGTNLQKYLDTKGPMPWKTAVNIVIQSCKGLQHAHERNMVHRDIKPGNILVDKTGQVKILDLGLARSFQISQDNLTMDLSDGKDVMGSIDYIAPEQAIANNKVDVRADIYSLGATLYCLITGKPPVEGTTAQKLLQHQMSMPAPINRDHPEVPDGVATVVAKMMAKKPEHRFQTPMDVAQALTPFISSLSQPLPALSSTQLHLSLAPSTGNLYKPGTSNLLQTSPIPQGGNSKALSGQSTKIEAKSATKRVKPSTKPITLESNISPRTLMIIGGIAAVLIPLIAIFFIMNSGPGRTKVVIPQSEMFAFKGDKHELRASLAFPAINVKDTTGKDVKFPAAYKNKVTVVIFWGYWCQHSTKELPYLQSLAEKYADRPYATFGINTDTTEDFEMGNTRMKLPWVNVPNIQANEVLSKQFGIKVSPTVLIVDHRGFVRNAWEGPGPAEHKEIETLIEKFVKEAEQQGPPISGTAK
jgi:serine/threonine protein kinase/peroxiredoxin